MKRTILSLMAVLVLIVLTMTVFADSSLNASILSTADEIKKGNTVKFTVSLGEAYSVTNIGVEVQFDSNLSIEGTPTYCGSQGAMINSFDSSKNKHAVGFQSLTSVSGNIFEISFKGDSVAKNQTVTLTIHLNNGSTPVGTKELTKKIDVVCAEHDFSKWAKVDDNTHSRTCGQCGATETKNHFWNDGEITKNPDCKNEGEKKYTCSDCGAVKTQTISVTNIHDYSEYQVTVKPGCETEGVETAACKICEKKIERKIPALGHDFSNPTVTKSPTCTETGIETGTCIRCEKTATNTIKALGHKFGAWTVTHEATCTENGEKTRECSECNTVEKAVIKAKGHDFEDPKITKLATLYSEGLIEGICKTCGASAQQVLPCSEKDLTTGITMQAKLGVFAEGTKLNITEIRDGNVSYNTLAEAVKEYSDTFKVYMISADTNGVQAKFEGEYSLLIPIPENYGNEVFLFTVSEDGTMNQIADFESVEDGIMTVTLSKFETVVLCNSNTQKPSEEDIPADKDAEGEIKKPVNIDIIVISVVIGVFLVGGAFYVFEIRPNMKAKKNKK